MKIISLGLGVQSTAMYMMSSLKYIDRADHAIFADPGAELPQTYKILEYLNLSVEDKIKLRNNNLDFSHDKFSYDNHLKKLSLKI